MRYLRSRGEALAERTIALLDAADQQVVRGMLLPSSWYPTAVLTRLEAAIAQVLAEGDRQRLFVDMGRYSAESSLGPSGVQRAYLREGDPHFVLRHVPRMYSSQHTSGQRTYDALGETSALIRALGEAEVEDDDCLTAVGWLARAIELSGGRDVRVEELSCRRRGAPHCEYRCTWR